MEVFVPISSACLSGNIVRMEEGEEQKNGVGDGDLMMMTGHDDDSFSSFLSLVVVIALRFLPYFV